MMKKRFLVGALTASLLLAGGCSKEEGKTSASGNPKLSVFLISNGKPLNMEWDVFKKAAEATNTTIVPHASKNANDANQAYNLMVASNDLADIISHRVPTLERLGGEGGLIPLNDLIEEHGPNIKKFMEEHPIYRKDMISVDGNIYALSTFNDFENMKTRWGLFIRTDWLDKFGLPVPTNLEELKHALTVIIENDANGNGKKDEVGIFARGNTKSATDYLLGIFGLLPYTVFYPNEQGKIIYAPYAPNTKEILAEIAEWYKLGLIDKEIFTRGWNARDVMLGGNQGAFACDWLGSTGSYSDTLKDVIPGFKFEAIPPLEGINGEKSKMMGRNTTSEVGWGISVNAKDPVAAIKYMDWWYSEEGRRTWNFGIEGKHYEMVNGQPIFTDLVLKNPEGKTPLQVLMDDGAQIMGPGVHQDANYELQWINDTSKQANEIYSKPGNTLDPMPIVKYTEAELKELEAIIAKTNQLSSEYYQKWILGASDINKEWDAYMNEMNALGAQRAMEIVQIAYDRYNKN